MPFRVVVIARSVEGDPWAQIRRSVPVFSTRQFCILFEEEKLTGITFLLFPKTPLRGSTKQTAQYKLPPAFSTTPTTIKTPVSLAILSRTSLVPSPLTDLPSPTSNLFLTQSSPAPAGVSPKSTADLKYCKNCSRPAGSRDPTAQPKVHPRGYPPRYASGKRRRCTPRFEARVVVRSRAASVRDVEARVRDWETATVMEDILEVKCGIELRYSAE